MATINLSTTINAPIEIVETVSLTRCMTSFLITRNKILKRMAETEEWKQFLDVKK